MTEQDYKEEYPVTDRQLDLLIQFYEGNQNKLTYFALLELKKLRGGGREC